MQLVSISQHAFRGLDNLFSLFGDPQWHANHVTCCCREMGKNPLPSIPSGLFAGMAKLEVLFARD